MDPYHFIRNTWLPPLISLSLVVTRRKINFPYFSSSVPAASCEQGSRRYTFIAKITASTDKTLADIERR